MIGIEFNFVAKNGLMVIGVSQEESLIVRGYVFHEGRGNVDFDCRGEKREMGADRFSLVALVLIKSIPNSGINISEQPG